VSSATESVDAAIGEVSKARALVSRIRSKQVRGDDQLASLKSVANAWFHTHRGLVVAAGPRIDLTAVDDAYNSVLDSTARSASRKTYLDSLKQAKEALVVVRSALLTARLPTVPNSDDIVPDFASLVGSPEMREVLARRWVECRKCVDAEAHLAAIVMMGGLLEALFVARANKLVDKAPLIGATSAPKDKAGKTLNYQEWMLDSYIKVGHELNWITDSARQVADILKEFRNYVHPAKELRHGVSLALNDFTMFWNVTKALARQLLASAQKL
jgi:hypothetical protein